MIARDLAETVICPRCHAGIGDRCRTRSDRTATWPHGARTQPLFDAWHEGYQEGEYGVARMVLDSAALATEVPDDATPPGRLLRYVSRIVRSWEERTHD